MRINSSLSKLGITAVLLSSTAINAHGGRPLNLQLKDLGGHSQSLSALRGQVVVLTFWATWCGPCQEELPRLSRLSALYSGKNVHFVAVSIDEPKDRIKIQPFFSRENVNLEVWVGGDTDTLSRFGLGGIVPGTVILDGDGQAVSRIMGEARDEDVRICLDWLLGGRTGPRPEAMVKRY